MQPETSTQVTSPDQNKQNFITVPEHLLPAGNETGSEKPALTFGQVESYAPRTSEVTQSQLSPEATANRLAVQEENQRAVAAAGESVAAAFANSVQTNPAPSVEKEA